VRGLLLLGLVGCEGAASFEIVGDTDVGAYVDDLVCGAVLDWLDDHAAELAPELANPERSTTAGDVHATGCDDVLSSDDHATARAALGFRYLDSEGADLGPGTASARCDVRRYDQGWRAEGCAVEE
jgi:hypothetical protein